MGGNGAHGVVGDASGGGTADPCRIGKKRIKSSITTLMKSGVINIGSYELVSGEGVEEGVNRIFEKKKTHIIEININPTEVSENKIPNCVGPLNRLRIIIKGVQKPGIFGGNQLA